MLDLELYKNLEVSEPEVEDLEEALIFCWRRWAKKCVLALNTSYDDSSLNCFELDLQDDSEDLSKTLQKDINKLSRC